MRKLSGHVDRTKRKKKRKSKIVSLEIFQFFSFGEFYFATTPGVWQFFDLWIFKEWTNERIPQSTNIIFENHFKTI